MVQRNRPARPVGVVLCVAGAVLVASSAALVDWTPSRAAAAGAPLPAPEATGAAPRVPAAATPPVRAPVTKGRVRAAPAREQDPEAAPPRRLEIEAVGVDTRLVNLRRQRDGALEVPSDFALAGWYRDGVKPGDRGPAVLVGHVDSYEGPAVFYALRDLERGDRMTVERVDGSRVVFEVYDEETVAKDAFPTARVYGDTDRPELRLLTCGGPFDAQTKHYLDNLVVYAKQVSG